MPHKADYRCLKNMVVGAQKLVCENMFSISKNIIILHYGSTPFRLDPIDRSKPDPGCSDTTKSLYQNHFSKTRGSDFNLWQVHKHLQIQCNYFTNMHLTKNGILCRLQHNIKNCIQL